MSFPPHSSCKWWEVPFTGDLSLFHFTSTCKCLFHSCSSLPDVPLHRQCKCLFHSQMSFPPHSSCKWRKFRSQVTFPYSTSLALVNVCSIPVLPCLFTDSVSVCSIHRCPSLPRAPASGYSIPRCPSLPLHR